MKIRYDSVPPATLNVEIILELMKAAGILNAGWTTERMTRALRGSALAICAWNGDRLIGFARVISDFAWISYLSHLAIHPEFQRRGVGKRLVEIVLQETSDETTLLVHSADSASGFYRSAGFEPYSNVFRIARRR